MHWFALLFAAAWSTATVLNGAIELALAPPPRLEPATPRQRPVPQSATLSAGPLGRLWGFALENTGAPPQQQERIRHEAAVCGTLLSDEPQLSIACVQLSTRVRSIRVGDELLGCRVEDIARRAVVLSDGSRIEWGVADSTPARSLPPPSSTSVSALLDTITPDELQSLQVAPAFEAGRAIGFRLSGIRPNSALHLAGLKNGDVVTHINGRALLNPSVALELYRELKAGEKVTTRVQRQGVAVTLSAPWR